MVSPVPLWFKIWLGWLGVALCFCLASCFTGAKSLAIPPEANLSVSISADGKLVAYEQLRGETSITDIRLFRVDEGKMLTITQGANGPSRHPALDGQGNLLVFSSLASNLVVADLDAVSNVFVYDVRSANVQRIDPPVQAVGRSGSWNPSISRNGNSIAFGSSGASQDGVRRICLYNRVLGTTRIITGNGYLANPLGKSNFSPNDKYLAFSAFDTKNQVSSDIYLASVGWGGEVEPSLAARMEPGPDKVGSLVTSAGTEERDADACEPYLTRAGCFFSSFDSHLSPSKDRFSKLYYRDFKSPKLTSIAGQGNGPSFEPCASQDGRWVAFSSLSDNLVSGDRNGQSDVFLLDQQTQQIQCLSSLPGPSYAPSISDDGSRVAFVSGTSTYLWQRAKGLQRLP